MASDIRLVDEEVFVEASNVHMPGTLRVNDIQLNGGQFLAHTIPSLLARIEKLENSVKYAHERINKYHGIILQPAEPGDFEEG